MKLAYVRRYAEVVRTNWWSRSRHEFAGALAARSGDGALRSVLDVGSFNGALLETLPQVPLRIGVDISKDALALIPARLPFADAQFDGVMCLDVLEHIADDAGAAAEMARVLRPGGVLVLAVPAYTGLWTSRDVYLGHQRRYRRAQLESVVRAAGLDVAWCTHFSVAMVAPLLALRALEWLTRRTAAAAPRAGQLRAGRLNDWLYRFHTWEARLALRVRLPVGSSIACVACKPV